MRKVVLYELLSLDGVAEEPSWFMDGGPEVIENLGRVIGSQDDVLLGRRTYDYWAGHWPTSDMEPFASFINTTPKHVVTSSAPAREWANSTLVTTPPAGYVADLKQEYDAQTRFQLGYAMGRLGVSGHEDPVDPENG